jgi:hypothetical protein
MGARIDPNDVANTPWTFDRQSELISLAFACDVTRFASLQYSIGDTDSRPCPWLGNTRTAGTNGSECWYQQLLLGSGWYLASR